MVGCCFALHRSKELIPCFMNVCIARINEGIQNILTIKITNLEMLSYTQVNGTKCNNNPKTH